MSEEYPIIVKGDGIIVKAKNMKKEEIYHCVYRSKVYLFFKDEHELLNCYEVEDMEAAEAIKANPSSDSIKNILENYVKKHREQ